MIVNWTTYSESDTDKLYYLIIGEHPVVDFSFRNHYNEDWQVSVHIGHSRNFLFKINRKWNKEKFILEVERRLFVPKFKKVIFDNIFDK